MKPLVGAEISLRIDSLAAGGDGVGRQEGRAVFVPLTAPGDLVRVRLTQVRKRHAHAELLEVLEAGRGRREAPCAYYGTCGGCDWMHLSESEQGGARVSIVRDALRRIAGLTDLPEIAYVASPASLGYRSRARIAHVAGRVGFRARSSHELIDIDHCVVLDKETQTELERVRARVPRSRGELLIRGYGDEVDVAGRTFHVGPRAFFQANRPLWPRWLEVVHDACGTGELAVELYAGVGFYTAGLSSRYARVIAVERGRHARDARRNAQAEIVEAAAEDWAPATLPALKPDLVLVNPPRSGCHPEVVRAVANSGATRLVYVSCEPSTLARDVRGLADSHSVIAITCIDALPNTHHAEVVCVMKKGC